MDNLLTKKPQEPKTKLVDCNKYIQNISRNVKNTQAEPKLQDKFSRAVIYAGRLMFSPETHKTLFLSQLHKKPALDQDLSSGILNLLMLIVDRTGSNDPETQDKKVPGALIIPLGAVLLLKAFDYLQQTDYPGATETVLWTAYKQLIETILKREGYTVDQIPQIMQKAMNSVQGGANNG